jgi:hypothetical protein
MRYNNAFTIILYRDSQMDKKTKDNDIKVNPKGVDPKKYIDIAPTYNSNGMQEAKSNTAVITFGRFSPPTIGHEKLVNKIKEEAKSRRADALIYASHTYDKKKNPLDYQHKIKFLTTAFGNVVKNSNAKTIIEVATTSTNNDFIPVSDARQNQEILEY